MFKKLFLITLTILPVFFIIKVAATEIKIVSHELSNQQYKIVDNWLVHGINTVERTLDEIPEKTIHFTITKHSNAREPVPWAQVIRGNPNIVKLHIDQYANINQLTKDWTLYHELAHLYLPYLDDESFWINEGFATYIQYLTMFQGRVLTKENYINRMLNGLKRGKKQTKSSPGRLSDVTANMWQLKAYKRVYWTGAAFFIEIEQQLIQRKQNLANIIAKYSKCCLKKDAQGNALMRDLDNISDTDIFTTTYQRYLHRKDFPTISDKSLETIADYYLAD